MPWQALLVTLGALFASRAPNPPPPPVRIAVAVETAAGRGRADTTQPAATRLLVHARAGESPRIRWFVQNRDRKRPTPEAVFHLFITREERAGQDLPRDPQRGTLLDNSYATELAPGDSTTGTCQIPIDEPGIYLVQFELLDRAAIRGLSCAVEIQVE
jgi:hypothetical protein